MVDSLAEKVDECLLNQGCSVLFVYNWDRESCLLYRLAGCPLFRVCLSIEVNGKKIGTFRIVWVIVGICCWGVSLKWAFTLFTVVFKKTLSTITTLHPLTTPHAHSCCGGWVAQSQTSTAWWRRSSTSSPAPTSGCPLTSYSSPCTLWNLVLGN